MTATSPGQLALTIAVDGQRTATLEIPFADVTPVLGFLDEAKQAAGVLDDAEHYYAAVDEVYRYFREARRAAAEPSRDEGMNVSMMALWLAFNHPKGQGRMKKHVAQVMRDAQAKVHITLWIARAGLSIALANEYVDLSAYAAAAPDDEFTQFVGQPLTDEYGGKVH